MIQRRCPCFGGPMTRFGSVDNAHHNPVDQYSSPFGRDAPGNLNGSSTFASNRFINPCAHAYANPAGWTWNHYGFVNVEMRNVGHNMNSGLLVETGGEDIVMAMANDDDDNMNVDPPSFSSSFEDIVMIDIEHETDDMDVEVRLENGVGASFSAADDSPHSGNDAFRGLLSSFMSNLIEDDEDQQVVPYVGGTPGLDDGLFDEDAVSSQRYDYMQRLDDAYAQASLTSPLGGDWACGTEGVPIVTEPVPVVSVDDKQRVVDFSEELDGVTRQFQDLCISNRPTSATSSALFNQDEPSASGAAPLHTTNVFNNDPTIDNMDRAENRLEALQERLRQRENKPEPNFTPQTPVKSKKEEFSTECSQLSPLVGCEFSASPTLARSEPKSEIDRKKPQQASKFRICADPRFCEPKIVVPARRQIPLAEVSNTGGKVLLWGPIHRPQEAATTTEATTSTPPSTPPKKTKKKKQVSKAIVHDQKVTKPIPRPPAEKMPDSDPPIDVSSATTPSILQSLVGIIVIGFFIFL